jgi:hypothetical protein
MKRPRVARFQSEARHRPARVRAGMGQEPGSYRLPPVRVVTFWGRVYRTPTTSSKGPTVAGARAPAQALR